MSEFEFLCMQLQRIEDIQSKMLGLFMILPQTCNRGEAFDYAFKR